MLGFCGLLSAALAIAVTSVMAFRTGVFGRLLAWLGVACAAGLVAANVILVGVIAIPAMMLWTVAISVAFWQARPKTASAAAVAETSSP